MTEAIRLARKGRGRTAPNPMVGAVVVRGREIVGHGYHRAAGRAHAEIVALEAAGERARDAVLYVNLEPCCHYGRTGPCTDRIIRACVSRVIVSHRDPFPEVAGKGIRRLRRAGIAVELGDGKLAALRLNEAYLTRISKDRPWVDLKMASTLDGKIADRSGGSKWITGERARKEVHRIRSEADAILVGIGTVLADNPRLDVRSGGRTRERRRIILDRRLRTPVNARIITGGDPSFVTLICDRSVSARKINQLEQAGASVRPSPGWTKGRKNLTSLLKTLAGEGVTRLLVEGGGEVAGSFIESGFVDRLHFFIAPKAIGQGTDVFRGLPPRTLAKAVDFEIERVRQRDGDLYVTLARSRN